MKKFLLVGFFVLFFFLLKSGFVFAARDCSTLGISSNVSSLGTLPEDIESLNIEVYGLSSGEEYSLELRRTVISGVETLWCLNLRTPNKQASSDGTLIFPITEDYALHPHGGCNRRVEVFLEKNRLQYCYLGDYYVASDTIPSCSISLSPPYPDKNTAFDVIVSGLEGHQDKSFELACSFGKEGVKIGTPQKPDSSGIIKWQNIGPLSVGEIICKIRTSEFFSKLACSQTFTIFENNPDPNNPPEGWAPKVKIIKPKCCNAVTGSPVDCSVELLDKPGVEAPGIQTALGCFPTSPRAIVVWMLKYGIIFGGGIAFLLMIWGGFQIIVSGGNPEKIKNGKQIITSALSGLLLIIFSVFLLRLIGVTILKIPGWGG